MTVELCTQSESIHLNPISHVSLPEQCEAVSEITAVSLNLRTCNSVTMNADLISVQSQYETTTLHNHDNHSNANTQMLRMIKHENSPALQSQKAVTAY